MSIVAAIYDPQPPGGTSGPIRWVTSAPTQASLDASGRPYAVIDGDGQDIGWDTHQVVDSVVQPLGATPPTPLTVLPPPGS